MVASSIHDGSDLKTIVRIINLSEKPRKFCKGELITEAELVEICGNEETELNCETEPNIREEIEPRPDFVNLSNFAGESVDFHDQSVNRLMKLKQTESDTKHLEVMFNHIGTSLSELEREEVVSFLKKNSDVFAKSEFDLGRTGLVKHVIDTGDNKLFKQQLRRHPMAHLPLIDEHVDKMLQNGIIEPSSSPWASNVVLVRKADNSLRFCVDYRKLNLLSVKDSYPSPRIDICFDALGEAKFFSTLDLQSAYWQVENHPDSIDKTSFVTRRGTFRFHVLSFGLSNAPAVFQRLMDLVMAGLTWEICLVFLDDIIVMAKTFEQHLERLNLVLDRLR